MNQAGSRLTALTGTRLPIVQAPMAGAGGVALAIAASRGGALGSLPCAVLSPHQVAAQVAEYRTAGGGPLNLNFFCHTLPAQPDETAWRAALAPFYAEEGVQPGEAPPLRKPFDAAMCEVVEAVRPEVVSFHFGLPEAGLLARVKAVACVLGNATSVDEARWLAAQGCDAVIAQGAEAGGHAGWFLDGHHPMQLAELVPAIAAAIDAPVIAAGGIVDAADVAMALRLGASGAQVGTAFLASPESLIAPGYRALLGTPAASEAAFTNVFTGREARGISNRLMRALGPASDIAPPFPWAANALAPLRARAEAEGRTDYSPLWAGAGAARVRPLAAETLTRALAQAIGEG